MSVGGAADAPRVGFVGVGLMGAGMARRLMAAGFPMAVIAHRNRAPVEALVAEGAAEAASLAELAANSDAIILCVSTAEIAGRIIDDLLPHLRPGMLLIDVTTAPPEAAVAAAARLAPLEVAYVEAPVSGGAAQAAEGTLGALVGADPAAFAAARPLLEACCASIAHFGPPGAAARAKLLYNYMALGVAALVIETFDRARDAEIDWAQLYEIATRGSGDSGVLRRIVGGALAKDPHGYLFSVENTAKDLRYFCEMCGESGGPSPLAEAVRAVFDRAVAEGRGAEMLSELLTRPRGSAPVDPTG